MKNEELQSMELGPIRPPSEASSLLLRITRNCPHNRCLFCSIYKGSRFGKRDIKDIIAEIDKVHEIYTMASNMAEKGLPTNTIYSELKKKLSDSDRNAFYTSTNWIFRGKMESVFIQDADSLIIAPEDMLTILSHLQKKLPMIKRITSYARADTIAQIDSNVLSEMCSYGLNRIHIGMESGSDQVLEYMHKGNCSKDQIIAGKKVKEAGMELSVYFMPGLGGRDLADSHVTESINVINKIDPDFIRIRTFTIPTNNILSKYTDNGKFRPCSDDEKLNEIRQLIKGLVNINSYIVSDHILNLLDSIEGRLPTDKLNMIESMNNYFSLSDSDKILYKIGRRTGIISHIEELHYPDVRNKIEKIIKIEKITPENIQIFLDTLMKKFI